MYVILRSSSIGVRVERAASAGVPLMTTPHRAQVRLLLIRGAAARLPPSHTLAIPQRTPNRPLIRPNSGLIDAIARSVSAVPAPLQQTRLLMQIVARQPLLVAP